MTETKNKASADEMIEALLEEYGTSREAVLGEEGLLAALKKRVIEKALAGELTHRNNFV